MAPKLHLFDRNLSSPVYVEDLTGKIVSLQHTTRLHGGYWDMTLRLQAGLRDFWEWHLNRRIYRLLLQEDGGKNVWEGRVEDVELDEGAILVQASGYAANLSDRMVQSKTYSAQTADTILKDLRDTTGTAEQLSTSNAHIDAPAVNLTLTYEDMTPWEALTNVLNGAANFTASDKVPWYVAVWDDRELWFKKRDTSAVTWRVRLADVVRLPRIRAPFSEVRNAVYALYLVSAVKTRTAYSQDTPSQNKYLRRDYVVRDLGESNNASAVNRANAELQVRKDLAAKVPEIILGRVRDANGAEWPLCRVRAGDVLRIEDLLPTSADVDAVTLDALRTFYLRETRCDHRTGQLSVVPDTDDPSLPKILARTRLRIG